MRYRASVVTAPEFELPDYSAITVELAKKQVVEEDVQKWLEQFRDPHATFEAVERRALAMGDYAVVTYEGKIGDQLLSEALPKAPAQLQGRRNAWIFMDEGRSARSRSMFPRIFRSRIFAVPKSAIRPPFTASTRSSFLRSTTPSRKKSSRAKLSNRSGRKSASASKISRNRSFKTASATQRSSSFSPSSNASFPRRLSSAKSPASFAKSSRKTRSGA